MSNVSSAHNCNSVSSRKSATRVTTYSGFVLLGCLFHFLTAEATNDVIIDHANCLHEGIANSRPNEVEAPLLQVFAYRVGQFGTGGQFG
jgi:hypothetical protein